VNIDGAMTLTDNAKVGANESNRGGEVFDQGTASFNDADGAVTNNDAAVGRARSTGFENDAGDTGGGIFTTQGRLVTLDDQSAVTDNDPNNCVGTNACGA
jgi:hypothetical protein